MLCSNCSAKDANFHYKYMKNGNITELHLCSECAKELGYIKNNDQMFNFSNFFGDFFSVPKFSGAAPESASCSNCGTNFDSIRKTGFVGCEKCYDFFARPIEVMLSKLQPSTVHKGKLSGADGKKIERENTLKSLKDELKRAIIDEKYEQAAVLRDKIREIEDKGENNNG